jgi:CheY-like chemotaxis protein
MWSIINFACVFFFIRRINNVVGRPGIARILVVDDSITVAKFTEMVLSARGHEITFAMDGEECIQKLNSRPIDIIILDVVMPGKNGFQLCREIKSNKQFGDIPIIMMTTKSQEADKFWGMRQGANAYLVKPCAEEVLINTVNKYAPLSDPAEVMSGPVVLKPQAEPPETETMSVECPETVKKGYVIPSVSASTPVSQSIIDKAEERSAPPSEPLKEKAAHQAAAPDAFYIFKRHFEQEARKKEAPELVGSASAPLSQTRKSATGELPALPKEEKQKKPLSLKERLHNTFYRFNN